MKHKHYDMICAKAADVDIIKLMKTDPDRYQSLSDEIMKAYAEGRVK